ncbi:hypothetical protein D770_08250 [Flammeovirgaceae bacterium 311]|nr:hypothetical protein D770_08250 [Flammeovirgaceae bacterium 311]
MFFFAAYKAIKLIYLHQVIAALLMLEAKLTGLFFQNPDAGLTMYSSNKLNVSKPTVLVEHLNHKPFYL